MKILISLAILLSVYLANANISGETNHVDLSLDDHWTEFKKLYNKVYEDEKEEIQRRLTWQNHLKFIEKHNQEAKEGKHTFTVKMNKFGDMPNEEFVKTMNGFKKAEASIKQNVKGRYKYLKAMNVEIPDSVDWRTQGYVTPIKNQGQCGSCWAFASVASLEGQHFKQTGNLVSLSEQNLVDCSYNFGNMGCNGGMPDQAFQYIKFNKGIDTEASYPYEGKDGNCRFNQKTIGATLTGFIDITSGDEDALTNAVATVGPISGALDAGHTSFQFYSSGIYSDPECSPRLIDHGTTIIGYGSLGQDQDYYIIKNMWGTDWGEQGYARIARNKNNMCGIASVCSYPLV